VAPGDPAPLPSVARAAAGAAIATPMSATPVSATPANASSAAASVESGQRLYGETCVICHGEDGRGGHGGGAPLDNARDAASIVDVVTHGRNAMPPFATVLTPEQIRDLAAYVTERLATPAR
jgi:mono/diheme cytochrome c family protein